MTVVEASHSKRAAQLIAARDAQIPQDLQFDPSTVSSNPSQFYRQVLSPEEVQIVELDATSLAAAIAARKYTSVEVTEAYLKSAAAAHAGTQCLAWFDVKLARERANWLDEQMGSSGPVGPLHGVPMSVKGELRPRPNGMVSAERFRLSLYQRILTELRPSLFGRLRPKAGRRHDCHLSKRRSRLLCQDHSAPIHHAPRNVQLLRNHQQRV